MGVTLQVLDPSDDAPASVAARHVAGHFREAADILRFAQARARAAPRRAAPCPACLPVAACPPRVAHSTSIRSPCAAARRDPETHALTPSLARRRRKHPLRPPKPRNPPPPTIRAWTF